VVNWGRIRLASLSLMVVVFFAPDEHAHSLFTLLLSFSLFTPVRFRRSVMIALGGLHSESLDKMSISFPKVKSPFYL